MRELGSASGIARRSDSSDYGMTGSGELERLRRHASALATFGGHALRTHDLDLLLREAAELVSKNMGIELVKVLELLADQDTFLVRAGVNWNPGVVGTATFGAHSRSPAGYALREDEPVVSPDLSKEDRFDIPNLLIEHSVKSMVNVVIRGDRAAWGVLEVDSHEHRSFTKDDVAFLQNYANLIAGAIERLQTEHELRDAANRRSLLLGELQHRVRNMLLNVRSLAKRTLKGSGSLEEFAAAFDARLLALTRTQELLTREAAVSVRLEDTLRQELQAHGADGGRVRMSGPAVRLLPKVAQALGMAFHELATNASKYGALGRTGAQLKISWQTTGKEEAEEVLIVWRESGVPISGMPTRRGFGSEMIERSLPFMVGGEARVEYHADGVECTIRFPVGRDQTVIADRAYA
jgi:two-component sensor histidine kinase